MNYAPEMIGVGKYTGELAGWLSGRGYDVEVVTAWPHYPGFVRQGSKDSGGSPRDGVRVFRCPLLLRNNGRGIWRLVAPLSFALAAAPVVLWRALRRPPGLVLCVEPTLLAAPAAILAARLTGARLALHVQDLEVDAAFATHHLRGRTLRALAGRFERIVLRAFDGLVTISDAMAARLATKGASAEKIAVVRNWIAAPSASDQGAASIRCKLGIGPDETLVLYAGHLGLKQGVPLLLDALTRLRASRELRVVIIGDGPMAAMVRESRATLPGLVHRPPLPRDEHEALLHAADIHVLPQAAAAADLVFPSKLGAMLATGRPVVVTAAPATELCRWLGDAAVVVPPGDAEELARGIAQALDAPAPARAAKAVALARTLHAEALLPVFEATLMRVLDPTPVASAQEPWPSTRDAATADPQRA